MSSENFTRVWRSEQERRVGGGEGAGGEARAAFSACFSLPSPRAPALLPLGRTGFPVPVWVSVFQFGAWPGLR